jgi:lipoate synthase
MRRPTPTHSDRTAQVQRYVTPAEFDEWKSEGERMGFKYGWRACNTVTQSQATYNAH